jgi:hypothetical protein
MAWTRRIQIVDKDVVANSIRNIAHEWDSVEDCEASRAVVNAILEHAEAIGIDYNAVLTDKQVKELKRRNVL